ncbi:hypothetical protein JTE90_020391 [Oedothorax gibbosus]|uniref:Uncharacterized protein n=1 Tax=Oedothorax gibbosus TaxID=931172 RepID=A0AAV6UDC4_9ARAC|nr:hypothetical protein JTE90_020391 [Oedothorax gibbosus]
MNSSTTSIRTKGAKDIFKKKKTAVCVVVNCWHPHSPQASIDSITGFNTKTGLAKGGGRRGVCLYYNNECKGRRGWFGLMPVNVRSESLFSPQLRNHGERV